MAEEMGEKAHLQAEALWGQGRLSRWLQLGYPEVPKMAGVYAWDGEDGIPEAEAGLRQS